MSTWPAPAIGPECTCVRNSSRRFVLVKNELCAECNPAALKRHQIEIERRKENGHLKELENLQVLLPGKIVMTKRRIDALNKQLRELGE